MGDRPLADARHPMDRDSRRHDLQQRLDQRDEWRDNRQDRREDWHDWNGRYAAYHLGWHHGYWHGNYGSRWHYMWDNYPVAAAFGVTAWGVNRLAYSFGYWNYYNPYYTAPVTVSPGVVIDYSQPLVVNQATASAASGEPAPATESGQPATPPDPSVDAAMQLFDAAREAFRSGDYDGA
ncbi:MAG: hypothetical protein ACF8TS_23420, partial [Maioricimonas sp. JB049]